MRSFFELLPFRIRQALPGRWLSFRRVAHKRRATASRHPAPEGRRTLFIDMAVISNHDAGTGIQRVVREIALATLDAKSPEWDIRFVSASRKLPYQRIAWPDATPRPTSVPAPTSMPIQAKPGDVFMGLDYSLDAVRRHRRQLARFRKDGGALWFLVHDLLPLDRPDWFSRNTVIRYKAWLGIIASLADGFLCNSEQTEIDLRRALARVHGLSSGYRTQVLPMGHVIPARNPGADTPAELPFDVSTPFALMVGTLEPRKGHKDIIAAFNELWRRGETCRLVLVGRLGWQVDALRDLILAHPRYGTALLWFTDIADAQLFRIYEACSGVIVGSYGEGFGLPIVEALGHERPVLARDLPVFRPHMDKGVYFFPADAEIRLLAAHIARWLAAIERKDISVIRPDKGWHDAATVLLTAISHPGARYFTPG